MLLTGFGPFRDVNDNPSARLVRALDGGQVAGRPIVGRVLPVSFSRGPALALSLVEALDPVLVLGFGVAVRSERVRVETQGRWAVGRTLDVDGVAPKALGPGPERVEATVDVHHLAELLDADLSEDAGTYVCNAWAWTVPQRCRVPAVFVHLPPPGVAPERVIAALRGLLGGDQSSVS